jgi:hypothetical protein
MCIFSFFTRTIHQKNTLLDLAAAYGIAHIGVGVPVKLLLLSGLMPTDESSYSLDSISTTATHLVKVFCTFSAQCGYYIFEALAYDRLGQRLVQLRLSQPGQACAV